MAAATLPAWLQSAVKPGQDVPQYRISPKARHWLRAVEASNPRCSCCAFLGAAVSEPDAKQSTSEQREPSAVPAAKPRMHDWVDVCSTRATTSPPLGAVRLAPSGRHTNGMSGTRNDQDASHTPNANRGNDPCMLPNSRSSRSSSSQAVTEQSYDCALRWLTQTQEHLHALERLQLGQAFRRQQLRHLLSISPDGAADSVGGGVATTQSPDKGLRSSVEWLLNQWILFDTRFRSTYSNICRAYRRLVKMEVQLNLLRTNSLQMLENDAETGSQLTDTPGSVFDTAQDSERYGKLVSIWSSKLVALRDRNLREFRQYVVTAVEKLRAMPAPCAAVLVEEVEPEPSLVVSTGENHDPPQTTYNAVASFELDPDELGYGSRDFYDSTGETQLAADQRCDTPINSTRTVSVEGVVEYTLDAADEGAECYEDECPDDYAELFAQAVDVVTDYCQRRGINEESSLEYVSRVSDLSSRLLPRIIKAAGSIPVYDSDFLDASVHCLPDSATDAGFHASASLPSDTERSSTLPYRRDSYAAQSTYRSSPSIARSNSSTWSLLSARSADPEAALPSWALRNPYVTVLRRTNLTVTDALRCFSSTSSRYRKLVCFSTGGMKDLFLNKPGAGATESVDVGSLLTAGHRDTFLGGGTYNADFKPITSLRCGPQTVLRALLTEDLASDEIDKIVHAWFPPLTWSHSSDDLRHASHMDREPLEVATKLDEDATALAGDADVLHCAVWRQRLAEFHSVTGRQLSRLLRDRHTVEPRVKYDSGGHASAWDFLPLRATCDFRNHIPIRYTMRQQAPQGGNHYNWVQSLFGNESEENCRPDFDLSPLETQANSLPLASTGVVNAVVVPIHRGPIELSEAYRTIGEMCDCVTDYRFPPLYEQHRFTFTDAGNDPAGPAAAASGQDAAAADPSELVGGYVCDYQGCVKNVGDGSGNTHRETRLDQDHPGPDHLCHGDIPIDTGRLGSVFVSRHSNLCLGSQWSSRLEWWDRVSVSLVFYLVCCDGADAAHEPTGDPENPESVIQQLSRMRAVLDGLDRILRLCVRWKVGTLTLPAALRCCFPVDSGDAAGCADAHMRCLATATHLTASLCRRAYPYAVNLVFPEVLRGSGVEKAASAAFTSRLNTF
ncbi:excinuclease ABC subunit UvrB [Babesia caballi]|uniref:Excinuclease ABC subunit UvrB n=1 Tax=Babesia caballi TaxID=5871 RepID=A0AAV4LXR4_BABCB|nr:excinuclease ABC subunit UvrB [Babesia caballi]